MPGTDVVGRSVIPGAHVRSAEHSISITFVKERSLFIYLIDHPPERFRTTESARNGRRRQVCDPGRARSFGVRGASLSFSFFLDVQKYNAIWNRLK